MKLRTCDDDARFPNTTADVTKCNQNHWNPAQSLHFAAIAQTQNIRIHRAICADKANLSGYICALRKLATALLGNVAFLLVWFCQFCLGILNLAFLIGLVRPIGHMHA
jgi:hypothetical protein